MRATWHAAARRTSRVGPTRLRTGRSVTDDLVAVVTSHKRIALVAHDNKKADLLEWALFNRDLLARQQLMATGTMLEDALQLPVDKLRSGPPAGISRSARALPGGKVDLVLFFRDPLQPQPHDPDVKALLRLAVVWNIPVACNRASADDMISSPLLTSAYERRLPVYASCQNRMVTARDIAEAAMLSAAWAP